MTPLDRLSRHQMTVTDVFELGRMRHLDLLALYWRLRGDSDGAASATIAQASPGNLVRLILEEARQLGGRHG
jgi:hypothetical protein